MAENKKSFILYCDLINTVKKMPIDKRGKLFTIILEYVNDENPITTDLIVDLVFEPIKLQLKRDLKKWDETLDKKSNAGLISALQKFTNRIDDNIQTIDLKFEKEICVKRLAEKGGTDAYWSKCLEFIQDKINRKSTQSTPVESDATQSTDTVTETVTVTHTVIGTETVTNPIINTENFSQNFEPTKENNSILEEKKENTTSPWGAPKIEKPKKKKETKPKAKIIELVYPYDSEKFMSRWNILASMPKWIGKSKEALQMSLMKLADFDEEFSISLIENAISGDYQGLVFADTKEKFNNYKNKNNGHKGTNGSSRAREVFYESNGKFDEDAHSERERYNQSKKNGNATS